MDYKRASSAKDLPKTTYWRDYAIEICRVGDLDPVYVALKNSGWHDDQVKRFCVALVTYYSKGVAAYLSQFPGRKFWDETLRIYPTAMRKPMRRHFRGELGLKALEAWRSRWDQPEKMMDELMKQDPRWDAIQAWTKKIPQFGNYFNWKLSDLYEVLHHGECSVDFAGAGPFMAEKSEKGLKLIRPEGTNEEALSSLVDELAGHLAPPYYNRDIAMQEVETVCCNWCDVVGKGYTMGQTIANYLADVRLIKSPANEAFEDGLIMSSPFSSEYLNQIIINKGY